MFTGIPADAFDFFEELAADNTKAWWTANRARYDTNVREPVDALLAALGAEFGPAAKIFRPYRDVRFSKDKTPYKTHLGATLTDADGSVWYLGLDATGLYVGGGAYQMAKEQLAAFRAAVASDRRDDGPALAAAVAAAEHAGFEVGGEQLKRVPPGYDKEHPRGRLLRHKGLYLGKHHEPAAWMGTKKAASRVAGVWRDLRPIQRWLHAHVGRVE